MPANNNVAMTLDGPYVDITVNLADQFSVTSNNKELMERDVERFRKTLNLIKQYLSTFHFPLSTLDSISVEIESTIPPSIGLASSAAIFSALAKALSGIIDGNLTDEQISIMARLGSGSAARSIFGGYGALNTDGVGYQIADENHWKLHDIIVVPSTEEKKVGSTEGHAGAWSSPHFQKRVDDVNGRRFNDSIDAIQDKDFEKLQAVAEEDCMDMHHCMQTQDPPLNYLSDETYRIIDEVKDLRASQHLPVLYTMDAGPTVHLFCTDEAVEQITQYANEQEGCKVFEAEVGQGASITG